MEADKERNKNSYIEIPYKYNDKPVVEIKENGFSYLDNLQTIYIPNSVETIGYEAFYKSKSLKTVNIPNSVKSIDHRAFAYCSSLKDVKLPNNKDFVKIEYELFTYCTGLGDIFIPHSVKNITTRAFEYAEMMSITFGKGLTKIGNQAFNQTKIKNGISVYDLRQWCNVEISSQISSPLYWGHKFFIINEEAHRLDELKNLVIPDEITTIGRFQFGGCTSIISADMNNVTEVKDEVFINCTNLESIVLNNDLNALTTNFFYNCRSLKEITIPEKITYIPNWCFYNCESLKKIIFKANITYISVLAFNGCKSLETIEIPGTEWDWAQVRKRDGKYWSNQMGSFTIICNGDGHKITKKDDLQKYSYYDQGMEYTYDPSKNYDPQLGETNDDLKGED